MSRRSLRREPTAMSRHGEPASRITYQPALDGMRGVAVLAVLFFHNGTIPPGGLSLAGGYLGVDLFLVLSGYLITALLLAEHHADGRIDLIGFWGRRARRLLPALLVALLLVALYCVFVAATVEMERIRADAIATIFYVQNWHLAYLDFASGSPLAHTWSLSVEEQWYIVWPLLFGALVVLLGRNHRRLAVATGCLAVAFTGWTWLLDERGAPHRRLFYGTDTRIASVLVGAALAFILAAVADRRAARVESPAASTARARRVQPFLEVAAVAGAIWIGWLMVTSHPSDSFMNRGGGFLFAIAAALVIAAVVHPESQLLRPLLGLVVLRWIGLVSYGVFLYHLPLFTWITPAHVGFDGSGVVALRFAATAVLAVVSFFLIERPVRAAVPKRVVAWTVAPVALVVAVVVMLAATSAQPTPSPNEPSATANPASIIALRHIAATAPADATKVLVVGDGSAFGLGAAVKNDYRGDGVVGSTFASLFCGLAEGKLVVNGGVAEDLPTCAAWPDQYAEAVAAFEPDVVALMVGAREPFTRIVDGATLRLGSDELDAQLRRELDRARTAVTGADARLLLLTVPCPAPAAVADLQPEQRSAHRIDRINRLLREYATAHASDVAIADLHGQLCTPAGSGSRLDNANFTPEGAAQTWAWLGEQARQAVRG